MQKSHTLLQDRACVIELREDRHRIDAYPFEFCSKLRLDRAQYWEANKGWRSVSCQCKGPGAMESEGTALKHYAFGIPDWVNRNGTKTSITEASVEL